MDDRYGGRGAARDYSYDRPPSCPPPRSQYYEGSQYSPAQDYHNYPPLPPGPPPPSHAQPPSMYHFGGQPTDRNARESLYGNDSRDARSFNFSSNHDLPSYPDRAPTSNRYRDTRDGYERRRDQERYHERRGRDHDRGRDRDRQPYQKRIRMAADRPLLHTRRDSTPDQLEGMQDSDNENPKFRDIENMSDSDSEVMDESHSEGQDSVQTPQEVVQEIPAPRWSNPEPYTSLPPPEASKKRKDVVKLIRKARIAAAKGCNTMKQLAQNDDFISFGLDDDDGDVSTTGVVEAKILHGSNGIHSGQVTQLSSASVAKTQANPIPLPVENNIAEKLQSHKRKRELEDVGDSDGSHSRHKRRLKSTKTIPTGEILQEWLATDQDSQTPWVGQHQWTENAGFRLHKEICDFYEYVKPCDFEETMRLDLLERIRKSIKKVHPDCEVHAFGSFAAGIYLPDADIDIVIVSRNFASQGVPVLKSNGALYQLASHLVTDGLATQESVEVLTKAKVPLVKFQEVLTGIRVDMSFENLTGPRANQTFKEWKSTFPAMPILVTVIKQFLTMRGLNEVVNGGIGGFSVTCLVTALLQNMPRVQSGELIPEQHLGEVLLEFLDLYGNQFDLYGTAIDLNPPRFVDKGRVTNKPLDKRENKLHIVDPNDRTNDISGGSRNVAFIFKMFSYARTEVLRAMRDRVSTSLLEWMLGGNYRIYADQRTVLKRLYEAGKWTSASINNEETLLNNIQSQTRNCQYHLAEPANASADQNTSSTKEEESPANETPATSTASMNSDPATLLAFRFSGAHNVRTALRKKHQDHITTISQIPEITCLKKPVFKITFDTLQSAEDALATRKEDDIHFAWDTPNAYKQHKLDAIETPGQTTRRLQETVLRHLEKTERALLALQSEKSKILKELQSTDGHNENNKPSKVARQEKAPSPPDPKRIAMCQARYHRLAGESANDAIVLD